MGLEIERRFLLHTMPDMRHARRARITQGYLSTAPGRVVRVRIMDDHGFLTVKGKTLGAVTPEFEYEIPRADAEKIMTLCGDDVLSKDRYEIIGPDGMAWDVDVFTGRHEGLMLAEIELALAEDTFVIPDWLDGAEITADRRLGNAALVGVDRENLVRILAEYGVQYNPAP